MIGIYKITSKTGKIYIGQAIDIDTRWKQYSRLICKHQRRLYNSLLKHGVESHVFEVVEECLEQDLNERERYWQEYYNTVGSKGLNCRLTQSTDKSGKLSKETVRKMCESKKGSFKKRQQAMLGKNTVKIRCITDGKIFASIKEATEYYNLKWRRYIEDVCAGRRSSTHGLQFEKLN
jgi:group I intron endonuclease